jgi:hypothetical protein
VPLGEAYERQALAALGELLGPLLDAGAEPAEPVGNA